MSNDGLGKARQKRSHGPNKPYERRKSLLGRVTDTVKDLIAPSWFSGLVGKTSADHAQREPPGEITEHCEEEQFMSPPQSPLYRPPVRDNKISMNNHAKPGPSNALSHFPGPSHESTPLIQNSRPARKLETTQPGFGLSQFTLPSDAGTTHPGPHADDNMSDHSDGSKSTSGCSSMIPHPDKREYQKEILQLNESSLQKLKDQLMVPGALTASTPLPSTSRSGLDSILHKRDDPSVSRIPESPGNISSLSKTWSSSFQTSRLRDQTAKSKPSFNLSLFGAPSLGNNSLFGDSLHESTFYPGKVGYGGASQFRKGKNRSSAPYEIAAPYRTKIKAKPVGKPSSDALTSSTAKRILETLERMSTPLTDAKKIPVDLTLSDSVLSFTPTSYLKRPRLAGNSSFNHRSLGFPLRGPPVNQLHTPTIASIAKNRQKLSARVETTPRPSTTSLPSTTPTQPFIDIQELKKKAETVPTVDLENEHSSMRRCETVVLSDSGRVGGKMKRDKSHHYSTKKPEEEDDVIEIPDLKTEYTLPLTNMPKFNFGGTTCATPTSKLTPQAQTSPAGEDSSAQLSSSSSTSLEFTFSNPIPSSKPEYSPGGGTPKLNFQFSSPINMNDKVASGSKMVSFSHSTEVTESMRNIDSNSHGLKPTTELKSGSVNDILGGMARSENNFTFDKNNTSNFKFGSGFPASKPKPKDGLTNSYNSPSSGFKPPSGLKQGSVMDILGTKSSPVTEQSGGVVPASNLKQGSVMDVLAGKTSPSKAQSGGVKAAPGLKQGSVMDILGKGSSDQSKADETWAKLCAASDKWECDTCMVRNKLEDSKCVACGSSSPSQTGTKIMATKPTGSIVTGMAGAPSGGSLWDQFKPAEGTWECPTCMIQNKSTCISCVACATSKPSSQGTPAPAYSNISGFGSKFLPPAGSWECDTCMIQNKAQDSLCVACQSPKPASKSGSITVGTAVKKSSGPWECDTCMINNKEEAVKCIACETPRPGAKSATATGGLKFAPTAFTSGQSGFNCGSSFASKDSSSSGGFKFGNLDPKGGETKGGFTVGSTPASSSTTTTDTSKTSGFVFGNQGSKPANTATGFSFGCASNNIDKAPPSGGFSFGSVTKDTHKTDVSSSAGSGFVFGKVPDKSEEKTSTGTGFTFGASTNKDSTVTTSTSTGFTFGNSSSSAAGPVSQSGTSSSQSQRIDTTTPLLFGHSAQCQSTIPAVKTESTETKVNSNFVFGQSSREQDSTKTLNNNTEVKLSQPNSKADTGGFNFTALPSQNTTEVKPAFGGLMFKKDDNTDGSQPSSSGAFSGFNSVKSAETSKDQGSVAVKRSIDEANAEPSAKKAFNFSANSSTSSGTAVFGFNAGSKATNNGPTNSDLFKFGQQPSTSTTPSTAPLGTGGFNSISSVSTAPAFGNTGSGFGSSSGFGTNTTTVTSVFGNAPTPAFGQTTGSFVSSSATPFGTASTDSAAFGSGTVASQETPSLFGTKANTFGGTSTPASMFGSANSFGSSTKSAESTTATFGGFNSAPAFGGNSTFGASTGSGFGSSTTATTSSTAPTNTGGFNFSTAASFNFGSTAATSSNVFQFGAKADTGPSAATAPQPPQSQTPAFGLPQPAQQPAQAFNFSATPNTSFSSSTPFSFNSTPSNDKNPFSIQGSIGGRRIKKAVRKARK